MQPKRLPYLLRNMEALLTIILFVMVAGYFSIVEERSINQVFKTISRVGMAGAVLFIDWRLKRLGLLTAFRMERWAAPLFYGLYLFLGFASFLWSSNWQYSALQWFMTFESLVFTFLFLKVVMVYNRHFPQRTINLVRVFARALFPILLTFLVGGWLAPDVFYRGMRGGEELRLGGWIMNPNELGMLASIGAAMGYLFILQCRSKWVGVCMMAVAIVVLVLTASRSSAIGFLAIMGLLILLSNNKKLKFAMMGAAVLAIPLLLRFVVFKDDGGVEEVMSMTGRIPFWTALLNEGIIKEPWLGYGFMRINYTDYFQGLNTYPGRMTHNTFMQILMNLGFVGLFIGLCNVFQTVRNFLANRSHTYGQFFIALFIPVIINSFTEFGIFGDANYGILFWQFLILLFVIHPVQRLRPAERLRWNRFRTQYALA